MLDGEDGMQSDGKSGMGLTEGEGAKDVSDQIESQDQLEDAKKDYNDQPEPDKDLKVCYNLKLFLNRLIAFSLIYIRKKKKV